MMWRGDCCAYSSLKFAPSPTPVHDMVVAMKRFAPPLLLAALSACQPNAAPAPAVVASPAAVVGDPARGLDIADRNCSLCHQVTASGASPHAMAPPFATLAQRYPLEALGEALAEGIVVGHRDMPQIVLEPQQIQDLLTYLQTIQQPSASPARD